MNSLKKFSTAIFFLAAISAHGQSNGVWLDRAPLPTPRQEMATAAFNGNRCAEPEASGRALH